MPRNMNWLRTASRRDLEDLRQYSGELYGFAGAENMPPEFASGLRTFAGYLETLAGDADEEEKERALNALFAFTSFFYNNGGQIVSHLEPERAEEFRKLAVSIDEKLDLRMNMNSVFKKETGEEAVDDPGILNIDREIAEMNNEQPAFTDFGPIVIKKKSPEELAGAPNLLDARQKLLMSCPDEMKELSEMFHTKKSFRLLNWNSDEYNKARNALDTYMDSMSQASAEYQRLLKRLERKEISQEDFSTNVKNIGSHVDKVTENLRRDMRAYAVHATGGKDDRFGDLSVDGKTQATGAARLSASMGILSFLDRADRRIGLEPEGLSETREKERVNEINFHRLYQKHFEAIEKGSDRHRRSASRAQIERKLENENEARMMRGERIAGR